jgi:hypothetical protein
MNSTGKVPRFQSGGYVGDAGSLDNNNTNSSSNVNNISTHIYISDNKVNSNTQANSENKDKNPSMNDETAKQLSNLINGQVTQILVREGRPGGILDSKYKSR